LAPHVHNVVAKGTGRGGTPLVVGSLSRQAFSKHPQANRGDRSFRRSAMATALERMPPPPAALDRNGLSVSTETACRFQPKSPVGNSEICNCGRLGARWRANACAASRSSPPRRTNCAPSFTTGRPWSFRRRPGPHGFGEEPADLPQLNVLLALYYRLPLLPRYRADPIPTRLA
jgi:hypothetical protein